MSVGKLHKPIKSGAHDSYSEPLLPNIILGWRGFLVTNALAYLSVALGTKYKSLIHGLLVIVYNFYENIY